MTREEAVKEIEKVFVPAFANYIITALTEGATVSDKEPTTKNDLAQERYQDLKEYFGDKETGKTILEDKKEFKAWLERVKWHVKRADEFARELEALKQEPRKGHWSHDGSHWKNRFICSECGYKLFDEPTNFCPNCGARMVEPQESEDKE